MGMEKYYIKMEINIEFYNLFRINSLKNLQIKNNILIFATESFYITQLNK